MTSKWSPMRLRWQQAPWPLRSKSCCGDHMLLFKAQQHWHRLLCDLFICVFYMYGTPFQSWDTMYFLFLGSVTWSPFSSFEHSTEFLRGGWQEKLRRKSEASHSPIQPLRRMSGDYLEFSACLKATLVIHLSTKQPMTAYHTQDMFSKIIGIDSLGPLSLRSDFNEIDCLSYHTRFQLRKAPLH